MGLSQQVQQQIAESETREPMLGSRWPNQSCGMSKWPPLSTRTCPRPPSLDTSCHLGFPASWILYLTDGKDTHCMCCSAILAGLAGIGIDRTLLIDCHLIV